MTTLTAPASGGFSVLEDDVYTAQIREVDVQDWTKKPDNFGKQGHYTLVFKLDVIVDGQDEPEDMWKYIGLFTGEKANLTKLTRALGLPDIQPGDGVDPDEFVGKWVRVSTLKAVDQAGNEKSRISGFLPMKKKSGVAQAAPAAKRPTPPVEDDDDAANTPF